MLSAWEHFAKQNELTKPKYFSECHCRCLLWGGGGWINFHNLRKNLLRDNLDCRLFPEKPGEKGCRHKAGTSARSDAAEHLAPSLGQLSIPAADIVRVFCREVCSARTSRASPERRNVALSNRFSWFHELCPELVSQQSASPFSEKWI